MLGRPDDLLAYPHPFLTAVDSYLSVRYQQKRLDVINSISKKMGYADGAITNIPLSEISRAADLIVSIDPKAERHFSNFLNKAKAP